MARKVLLAVGLVIYFCRLHHLVIWLGRRTPTVLLYHACEPVESAGIAGLGSNRTPELFAEDLAFLQRYYNVVPLSALETSSVPEKAVVLTFDDGYRSVYEHAFPILLRFGMTATVYLVTDVVGTNQWIWINEFNYLLRSRGAQARPLISRSLGCDPELPVGTLLDLMRSRYDPIRVDLLLKELRQATGLTGSEHPRMHLDWSEIAAMIDGGITFGNHTTNHPNMATLDAIRQKEVIGQALSCLTAKLGTVTSLAYPFGDHNQTSRRIALEAGHTTIMEVGGVNNPLDLTRVARSILTGRSDAQRFAELEIVAPAWGYLKKLSDWWNA
ncbi:MAG: polysaccharide deacetylase family protein [Pseudomonadota bacterium]|nr:polysaccharide deacetylase family protein [Pseudomonadota bacterium]